MERTITRTELSGRVTVPPSKSLSHRMYIAAELACLQAGEPSVIDVPEGASDDVAATVRGIRAVAAGTDPVIVDCGSSGTTLRFLLPIAAALGRHAIFVMTPQLASRPVGELLDCLRSHDVNITSPSPEKIEIFGRMSGGVFELPGDVSSQFISGLLMAFPLLDTDSTLVVKGVIESEPYVNMTLDVLSKASVLAVRQQTLKQDIIYNEFAVPKEEHYELPYMDIEGDWSAGGYWLTLKALGYDIEVDGLDEDSVQGDSRVGAELESILRGNGSYVCDLSDIPDLAPVLAVAAAASGHETYFCNAARLRLKESDRIRSICDMIGSLGGCAAEMSDGFLVTGSHGLRGGRVRTYGDHRIAMAASVAAFVSEGPVVIDDDECVSKSYPTFFEELERLRRHE